MSEKSVNITPEEELEEVRRLFVSKLVDALKEPNPKASLLDVARRYLQDPAKLPKPAPEPVKPGELPFVSEPVPVPVSGPSFARVTAEDLPFKVPA